MRMLRWALAVLLTLVFTGAASATVVIKGKVEYWDQLEKKYKPAKGVHVEVEGDWWEPDIDLPTDDNGEYEAHQRDPYWDWWDFDDVDIEVYAETPGVIQIFETWYSWYPYHAISADVDDVGAGETVTIDVKIGGELNDVEAYYRTPDETANAFVVHQEMLDHYRTLRQMGFPKSDFDETEVIIPAALGEKYYNPLTGFVNLGVGGFFGADDWANIAPGGAHWVDYNGFLVTVRHEYSHAIHDELTGFLPPLGFYPSRHSPAEESSSRWLAYTEGFAEFLPCATLSLGGRFEPTPTVVTPKSTQDWITQLPTENPYQDHYSWEGEVCAILWDLFDPANQEEHVRRPAQQTVDGHTVPWQIVHAQTWMDRIADAQLQDVRTAVRTKTGIFSGPVDTIQEFLGFWGWAHQDQRHALRTIAYNRCVSAGLPPEWPPVIVGSPTISRDMGTLTVNLSVQEKNPEDRPFMRVRAWHQVGNNDPKPVFDATYATGWQDDRNDIALTIEGVPFGTGETDVLWLVVSDEMAPIAYRFVNPPSVVQMQPIPATVIGSQGGTVLLDRLENAWMPRVEQAAPREGDTVAEAASGGFLLIDGALLAPVAADGDAARSTDAARRLRGVIEETRERLRLRAERTELHERTARLVQRMTEYGEAKLEDDRREPFPERQKLLLRAAEEEDQFADDAADIVDRLQAALDDATRGPLPQEDIQGAGRAVSDLQDALRAASETRALATGLRAQETDLRPLIGDAGPTEPSQGELTEPRGEPTPSEPGVPASDGQVSEDFEQAALQRWGLLGNAEIRKDGNGSVLATEGLAFGMWSVGERTDVRLSCRYRHGEGIGDVALRARGVAPPEYLYHVLLSEEGITVIREQSGQQRELARGDCRLRLGQWYSLEIHLLRDRMRVLVDGEVVLQASDPEPLPKGLIGLGSLSGTGFAYDDVALAPPERR